MAVLTLGAGFASRSGILDPALAKLAGVALWCAFVYWIIAVLLIRISVWIACIAAIVTGWCVEFLQLTPFPAWLASEFPLSKWVLGQVFHLPDLASYVVGAALAAVVHRLIRMHDRNEQ